MLKRSLLMLLMTLSGRGFKNELRSIEAMVDDEALLRGFSEDSLKRLLIYAHNKVSFYRRILREAGIIQDGTVHLENFSKLPILGRRDVQRHFSELLSDEISKMRYYVGSTGGSTGTPTKFVRDMRSYRWAKAAEIFYYKRFLGVDEMSIRKIDVRSIASEFINGIDLKKRVYHYLSNTVYLVAHPLTEEKLRKFVEKINSYRPVILRGFASSLFALARFILEKKLPVHSPRAIVSTAETLTPLRRRTMEEAFGSRVYNFYGAKEAPSIAAECQDGSMHIFSFNNLVEVLDRDGNPMHEDGLGRVVITPLHNYAMPLIRYEIGDMASVRLGRCRCGSNLPSLGKVSGRFTEFVVREDGSLIDGNMFEGIFHDFKRIKEFQIIQEDYNQLRILISLQEGVKPADVDIGSMQEELLRIVGGSFRMKWEFVDEIPKPPSGKYLYVRSLVLETPS